jgi:cytochrome P450
MTKTLNTPEVPVSLADLAIYQNPYPFYEKLVAEAPIYRDPVLGLYLATGFEAIKEITEDHHRFSSVPEGHIMAIYSDHPDVLALYKAAGAYPPINTLVTTDPPEHRRYRTLVEKAIGASSSKRLTGFVAKTVEALIDAFVDEGHAEFVAEFANRLPLIVLCNMLGVGPEFKETAHALAASTTRLADGTTITHRQLLENHQIQISGQKILEKYLDKYEAEPADNLTSHLLRATLDNGERLSRREIHSVVQALLVGGNDTTPGALCNCVILLAGDPDLQQALRDDPTRIGAFIEEAMRLESPVQGMYRRANQDTEVAGTSIPAGAPILLRFAAANRDPARFECPSKLDLNRKGIRNHMAFGNGIHYCVGNILARLEVRITLERLLARLADIALDPVGHDIRYVQKLAVRNPEALPLSFRKRA